MGRRRRRRAFPLGQIKANKRHRNCPGFGDRGAGVAGRDGDGRLGGEGEIPLDRLVNRVDLAAGLFEGRCPWR